MEEAQQVKTKRRFPLNLYNRLEQRLKNKSEETPQNTEEAAGIQAEKPQKTEESSLIKCPKCGRMVDRARVVKKKYICYECGGYFRVKTNNRIRMVADAKSFEPWFEDMEVSNPLDYEGYEDKLAAAREKTGLKEAVTVGRCKVFGDEIVLGICDSRFMMASMGHVVGEKITKAIERATELKLPVFLFCCSGGARMQEGIVSLMQMAKTSAAIKRHGDAGLLYCSVCGRSLVQLPQGSHGAPMVMCPTAKCPTVGSRRDVVEEALLAALADWLEAYKVRAQSDAGEQENGAAIQDAERSIARARNQLDALNKQKGSLYDLLEQGLYSKDVFLERSRVLAARITETERQIETLRKHLGALRQAELTRKSVAPSIQNVLDVYATLGTPAEQNALLKTVLDHVVYFKSQGGSWRESDMRLYVYPKITSGELLIT